MSRGGDVTYAYNTNFRPSKQRSDIRVKDSIAEVVCVESIDRMAVNYVTAR